jgi:anthranilate phosphoribosyltransferase
MTQFAPLLRRVIAAEDLTPDEAAAFVGDVMDGALTPAQSAGLLVALAAKGESVDEIVGAARAMRERAVPVVHDCSEIVDIVGTGGDGANTINISTMAALVVAASGTPVAKHGNRAASSACGSADVLEAAGLPIEYDPARAGDLLREAGFAFLFAPRFHPAMRNVGPVRRELGVRTMFNILGPLTNPARATHQVVGVARAGSIETIARVLQALGVQAGAVVHGSGGLDEVTGHGPTAICSFDGRGVRTWELDPAEYGIDAPLESIAGGSIERCRDAFFAILGGERSPRADVVALNAAVAFVTLGRDAALADAIERARAILASGQALRTFERAKAFLA